MRIDELKIPPEVYKYSRGDIILLKTVRDKLFSLSATTIIDSGYAVEAVMGGEITHQHDDLDIIVVSPQPNIQSLTEILLSLTGKLDDSTWVSSPTKTNWIWLQALKQDRPHQLNVHVLRGKPSSDEKLMITSSAGYDYSMSVTWRNLTILDQKVEILCPSLEFLVASKIRLIESYGNNPRPKDLRDLLRMINNQEFSLSKYTEVLSDYYVNRRGLPKKEAIRKAESELLRFFLPNARPQR